MLNLLKFKPKAEYKDKRPTDLTGRQAYGLYGAGFEEIMAPLGTELFIRVKSEASLSAMAKATGIPLRL